MGFSPILALRHSDKELVKFLEGKNVRPAVNTHHHEDNIGGKFFQKRFGIKIFSHPEAIPLINQVPKLLQYQKWFGVIPSLLRSSQFRK